MTKTSVRPAAVSRTFEWACTHLADRRFAEALWGKRVDAWTSDPSTQQKIAARLGWLTALDFVRPQLPRLRAFADAVRREPVTDIVVLGMGGSSLAPEVLRQVIGPAQGFPRLQVLDSVDPYAVRAAMASAATSLFVLASKSGSTIEPNVLAAEAQRQLLLAGRADWGRRFVAITDEGTALHQRAQQELFLDIFINPADIGGRFSALSFFGLVPAALMGVDLDAMVAAADRMATACRSTDVSANPGLTLGAFMAASAQSGRDKLTLRFADDLEAFALWVEQLVAESTGKNGRGVIPIAGESSDISLGPDRCVVEMRRSDQRSPVVEPGCPCASIIVPDPTALGAEFFRWECATAAAGFLLDVNPFDEPNVQQAKDATKTLLAAFGTQGRLPVSKPDAQYEGATLTLSSASRRQLAGADATAFLRGTNPPDFIGFLAYLPPDDQQFAGVFKSVRSSLGSINPLATTLGYGPRYLHSTGQLHKGGANSGVFIVITAPPDEDLPVPGEGFSFGVLEAAQASGDFQSLDRGGRRALHIHLPARQPQLLGRLFDELLRNR